MIFMEDRLLKFLDFNQYFRDHIDVFKEYFIRFYSKFYGEGIREEIEEKFSKCLFIGHQEPARIKTILNNLVSNAIKYSNSGVISIKCTNDEKNFVIIVQDEGIGIAKENIPFIFDRFYQVEQSRNNKYGTGLGLSIVKNMVELCEGMIDVDNTPGIGTTFTVTLPILK